MTATLAENARSCLETSRHAPAATPILVQAKRSHTRAVDAHIGACRPRPPPPNVRPRRAPPPKPHPAPPAHLSRGLSFPCFVASCGTGSLPSRASRLLPSPPHIRRLARAAADPHAPSPAPSPSLSILPLRLSIPKTNPVPEDEVLPLLLGPPGSGPKTFDARESTSEKTSVHVSAPTGGGLCCPALPTRLSPTTPALSLSRSLALAAPSRFSTPPSPACCSQHAVARCQHRRPDRSPLTSAPSAILPSFFSHSSQRDAAYAVTPYPPSLHIRCPAFAASNSSIPPCPVWCFQYALHFATPGTRAKAWCLLLHVEASLSYTWHQRRHPPPRLTHTN